MTIDTVCRIDVPESRFMRIAKYFVSIKFSDLRAFSLKEPQRPSLAPGLGFSKNSQTEFGVFFYLSNRTLSKILDLSLNSDFSFFREIQTRALNKMP